MKRDDRLRGLSSEHHQALVLGRKLSLRDEPWTQQAATALLARFERELDPHFRVEEEVLLPALATTPRGDLVRRTEADHAALRALVQHAAGGDADAAQQFGQRLWEHVRFEESELFPACEQLLPDDVLEEVRRRAPQR